MPPGGLALCGNGEHAQVEVGVGGDEEDFLDLRGAVSLAVPSDDEIAFLDGQAAVAASRFAASRAALACASASSRRRTSVTSSLISASFMVSRVIRMRGPRLGYEKPCRGRTGVGCYLFFGRGHPHTGQSANL